MDNKPGITSTRHWLMPYAPDEAYAEWVSWDDWLGVPLGFDEARSVVAELGITSQEQWWDFTHEQTDELMSLRVPAQPHIFYDGWMGYDHWLSLPETVLTVPANWRSTSGDIPVRRATTATIIAVTADTPRS